MSASELMAELEQSRPTATRCQCAVRTMPSNTWLAKRRSKPATASICYRSPIHIGGHGRGESNGNRPMADLLKLAERVEALSGPDTEVDALIWCALNGKKYVSHWPEYSGHNTRVEYVEPPKRKTSVSDDCALQWTTSLDAAMTLVERPAWIRIDEWPDEYNATSASVQPIRDPQVASHCARAATPALALCAAALRARAANG